MVFPPIFLNLINNLPLLRGRKTAKQPVKGEKIGKQGEKIGKLFATIQGENIGTGLST
jgi:hypothetical protein